MWFQRILVRSLNFSNVNIMIELSEEVLVFPRMWIMFNSEGYDVG